MFRPPPTPTLFPYTTLFRSVWTTMAYRGRYVPVGFNDDPESGLTGRPLRKVRSEEHTSELQSRPHLVCRLLLEKKNFFRVEGMEVRPGVDAELLVLRGRARV